MSEFPETDVHNKALNSGIPPEKFVIVGGGAVEVVVGPDVRRAQDTNLAVDDETYRQLRERHDLQERVHPDGYRQLTGDGYDISVGWNGRSVQDLQQRGYVHNGVHVAGLPDVYERKQDRDTPKDRDDLKVIKNRLYGPTVLPEAILQGELEFVKSFMPERLHNRPELLVAANGLVIVRTVFGHADEGVRTYSGVVETGQVPATYHEWKHSGLGARDGQLHIDAVEAERAAQGLPPKYTDNERLAVCAGYTNHDAILGDGRRAINPQGHDEKQSAELVARHLESVGAPQEVVEGGHATAIATTFNEKIKAQDIDPARGYIHEQQLGAGQDMSSFRRTSIESAVGLVPEDLAREAHVYGGALQKLVRQLNDQREPGQPPIRITTVEDAFRLIDEHPDFPVIKAGDPPVQMTLREAAADHLRGSARFMGGYQFAGGWGMGSVDDQRANQDQLNELAGKVETGEITLAEAYIITQQGSAGYKATVTASDDAAMPDARVASSRSATGRHSQEGSPTPRSSESQTAAGETNIATLRAAVEAGIAQLPIELLETARPRLETAMGQLFVALAASRNEQVSDAAAQLVRAQQLLTEIQTALAGGAASLQEYLNHIS